MTETEERELCSNVLVDDPETGLRLWLRPGTREADVEKWALEQISNPDVWQPVGHVDEPLPAANYGITAEGLLQDRQPQRDVLVIGDEEAEDVVVQGEPEVGLAGRTRKDLVAIASEAGVEVAKSWTKSRIIEAIESA